MHARQHYELVHFSRGNTELNYRRFFAVTTLAGVRVEDPAVFEATHELIRPGRPAGVAGLRVDHPDGLVDPAGYLDRLRALAPDAWITVEKILEAGEQLPSDWPVAGTTGYDAMREVNGVFVDHDHEPALTAIYQRLTGDERSIAEHVEQGKRMVVQTLLPAERRRMAALVPEVPGDVAEALGEVAVASRSIGPTCRKAPSGWTRRSRTAGPAAPSWPTPWPPWSPRLHDHRDELAARMQQLSGATMAKGVEDTAYYRYARFVALNEVGGDPGQFGIPLAEFHALQAARQHGQPESMTGLSTHDTKRGEDVRARLAVLAEIAGPLGRLRRGLPGGHARARTAPSATSWPRPWSEPGRSSGSGCTRTRRRPCARPRRHHLDRAGRRLRVGRARGGRPGLRRPGAADGLGPARHRRSPRPDG